MPNGDLDVSIDDCTLKVTVTQNAVEIQRGRFFRPSHANVIYVDKPPPSDKAKEIVKAEKEGVTFRVTRTLLTLQTRALTDSIKALQEAGRRQVDAGMYFQALAYAHLPYVNKVIDSYRSVSSDPFALKVAEWDVPLWFASLGDHLTVISLLPYAINDQYPTVFRKDAGQQPIQFASEQEVQAALNTADTPGRNELLDAWSLYYRGRYEDAIRSLITAIEIVLEAKLREVLANKGLSESAIEQRVERTWNDFEGRLAEYLHTTSRRMPGPYISTLPYINGVRLKIELENTRKLRHVIVHEGQRLHFTLKEALKRAMETTTWLYNWFVDDPTKAVQTGKNLALKSVMLGHIALGHEYTMDGVLVKSWEQTLFGIPRWTPLLEQLFDSIDKDKADVEKFALMCFTRLKYSQRADVPPPQPGSPFLHEWCYLSHSDKTIPVFVIDTCGMVTGDELKEIATRMLALKQQGKVFSSAMCLANHQNGLSWQLRETEAAVSEEAVTMARACGVTFVTTTDLVLLVVGAETYGWDLEAIKQSLLETGRQGTCPPSFTKVGTVNHFYERHQVVSVRLDSDPMAMIRVGDTVVVRLRDRYFQHTVDSLEVNHKQVTEVGGGELAGIKIPLHRGDVPVGAPVFCKKSQ